MRQAVDVFLELAVAVEIVDMLLDEDGEVGGADRKGGLAVAIEKEATDRVLADLLKLLVGVMRTLPETPGVVAVQFMVDSPPYQGFSFRTLRNAVNASSTFFGSAAASLSRISAGQRPAAAMRCSFESFNSFAN